MGQSAYPAFKNPVYNHSFPDPFVLKHLGRYYAFSTGHASDGFVFEVLRSHDLVHWQSVGGAMQPLAESHPHYWAPEVTYWNGRFYLYYSVGNETLMQIRVAVSDRPDGGFIDCGRRLTSEDFAIDAHVFRDEGGGWYLFYATDFLDHSHIGTGTVVDQMLDPLTLAGRPRPVTRPRYDWQVYDPARQEKGGVRWHTVEGPFVLKRKGVYYEMFSGGNWQNPSYGVSFAVTTDLSDDREWTQYSDGDEILPILRTLPGRVIGPGHNSVVRGPNNREVYCVYHRWEENGRVLAIDRMDFCGGRRLYVAGPTSDVQQAPYMPQTLLGTHEDRRRGRSKIGDKIPVSESAHGLKMDLFGPAFLLEAAIKPGSDGFRGPALFAGEQCVFEFRVLDREERAVAAVNVGEQIVESKLDEHFDPNSYHELRIEVDHRTVVVSIDEIPITLPRLSLRADHLLFPGGVSGIHCVAVELTCGFEELFMDSSLTERGWLGGGTALSEGMLSMDASSGNAHLEKNVPDGDFDLAINLSILDASAESILGIACGMSFTMTGPDFSVLNCGNDAFPLPQTHVPGKFHQLRFVRSGGAITMYLEGSTLGSVPAAAIDKIGIMVQNAVVELDMIRFTSI